MLVRLHSEATTTPKIRAEIQASNEAAWVLADRHGISEQTVYKWRHRDSVEDKSHTPHRLQTTLTPAQEAVAVSLRQTLLLPLDDLLAVVRGRSERMFGTLQNRLPQELRSLGITSMDKANRYLKEVFIPTHNARFGKPPAEEASAFVSFAGNVRDTLCVQEDRSVGNDNTVRYKNLVLQIAADQHRRHIS